MVTVVTKYIANDGTEHKTLQAAEEHEVGILRRYLHDHCSATWGEVSWAVEVLLKHFDITPKEKK